MQNKHVVISPTSNEHLEALADSWKMDKKEFLEYAINYFRVTGEDPTATKKDNIVKALKQLQNTLVSFIRKHESDHLKKIVEDFEATRRSLLEEVKKYDETDAKRLSAWMSRGMVLGKDKDQKDIIWSVRTELNYIISQNKNTEAQLKALQDLHSNKTQTERFIESKSKEVDTWATISTDGNKTKAKAIIAEIKSQL